MSTRRARFGSFLQLLLVLPPLLGSVAACSSGANSTLVTVRAAGSTDVAGVDFSVENQTDVPINSFFLAESEQVERAAHDAEESGSTAEGTVWGGDLLRDALPVGKRIPVAVPHPGMWEARAVDRDGRYQHIGRLKLGDRGRYILRLGEGNWRVYR